MDHNHIIPLGNVVPSTKNCNTENTNKCTVQCLIKCCGVMTLSVTMVLTTTLLIFLQDLGLVETCSVSCSPISVTLWFLLLYWLRLWPRLKGKGQDKKKDTTKWVVIRRSMPNVSRGLTLVRLVSISINTGKSTISYRNKYHSYIYILQKLIF